jgi:DnaK suppressor protein
MSRSVASAAAGGGCPHTCRARSTSGRAWIFSDTLAILPVQHQHHLDNAVPLVDRRARALLVPGVLLMQIGIRVFLGPTSPQMMICDAFWVPWGRLIRTPAHSIATSLVCSPFWLCYLRHPFPMKTMRERDLKFFQNLLNEKLEELLKEADRTVDGMTDAKAENFPDPTDRASLESNRNFTLRIRDRERKLIVKIKEALTRIDDGTYGNCEECGEKIGRERLEARPVTTLCIDCKSLQEAQERKLRGA